MRASRVVLTALLLGGAGAAAAQRSAVPLPGMFFTEFSLSPPPNTTPRSITAGPDGALWFTVPGHNSLGRCDIVGTITELALPESPRRPVGITVGADGNFWVSLNPLLESDPAAIGRITLAGGLTEFLLPPGSHPGTPVTGPDGALWFTSGQRIGRMTIEGALTTFDIPVLSVSTGARGITVGPDGNLWFITGFEVGRVTPGGEVELYVVPSPPFVNWNFASIAAGPSGALWITSYSDVGSGYVVRVSMDREVSYVTVPTPLDITVGPDGNLWVTVTGYRSVRLPPFGLPSIRSAIARVTPLLERTLFSTPTEFALPWHITVGPDGNLWYTQQNGIGRLSNVGRPARRPPVSVDFRR